MITNLKEILEKQKGSSRAAKVIESCKMLSLWEKVAGKRVAEKTEAIKIAGKVLSVLTPNPIWSQQLSLMRKEYVEKFNQMAGHGAIKDIKFKTTN